LTGLGTEDYLAVRGLALGLAFGFTLFALSKSIEVSLALLERPDNTLREILFNSDSRLLTSKPGVTIRLTVLPISF